MIVGFVIVHTHFEGLLRRVKLKHKGLHAVGHFHEFVEKKLRREEFVGFQAFVGSELHRAGIYPKGFSADAGRETKQIFLDFFLEFRRVSHIEIEAHFDGGFRRNHPRSECRNIFAEGWINFYNSLRFGSDD